MGIKSALSNLKNQTTTCTLRPLPFAGFTLVEILVVISLLSILALGAATMLADDGDWQRVQETPKRWDAIRKAIVGDGSIDATGNPELSGYVVDMGRLPQDINELITIGTQIEWAHEPLYPRIPTATCVSTQTPNSDCFYLAGGWRGPYLYTAGSAQYRDGWENSAVDGNPATTADDIEDGLNFGWQVSVSGVVPNHTDFFVRSLGFGNVLDATPPADNYRADFPESSTLAIVAANEWLNTQATLQLNVLLNKPVTADVNNLYIRIYYIENAGLNDQTSVAFSFLNTSKSASVSISPVSDLPIGRFAAVVYCESTPPATPATHGFDKVFDEASGTCNTNNDATPFYFQLRPSTNTVNVQWNLP